MMTGLCSTVLCTILLFTLYAGDVQAKISPPSFGDRTYVSKGSNVTLAWTYDFPGKTILAIQWFFSNNSFKPSEPLAHIAGGTVTILNSSLPNINIINPATLVLQNVSLDYNGTYRFKVTILSVTSSPFSDVLVIILEQPNATINCAQNVSVNEGENFTCLCNSTNGNPPPIASWSKDGGETINGTGYLSKQLILKNVSKTDIGTYGCKVKSHSLEDNETIQVDVTYGPTFINFKSNATDNIAQVGNYVKLTCLADGNPKPSYTITFMKNQTFEQVLTNIEGILIINNVNISDVGTYRCVAKNNLGSKEAELVLNVTTKTTQSTTTTSTTVPTSSTNKTTGSSSKTSSVTPTATSAPPGVKKNEKSDIAPIVGGAIGGVVFLIICIVLIWYCCCKRSASGNCKRGDGGEEDIVANPANPSYAAMGDSMDRGNPYESVDQAKIDQARDDESGPSNENPPDAGNSLPPVYAVVNKSKKTPKPPPEKQPDSLTYASLDPVVLQPDSSKMRDRTREETNYASIDLEKLKKDQE